MKENFEGWLSSFRSNIASYDYYTDFHKVYANVENVKVELNILNSLIGSSDIEQEFEKLLKKYPDTLKCIPILLAKREREISITRPSGTHIFDFRKTNADISLYKEFMRETGLFALMAEHHIKNLVDYVTGIEVGLDSNARKNRGGHLMENLVEQFLIKAGLRPNQTYFKEMYIHEIENRWKLDLSALSNQRKTEKRFDFVVENAGEVYGIETNFYASGGSKLNETARSYKNITLETMNIPHFHFLWVTDGQGWFSARHNLEETAAVLDYLYNIKDLENGIFQQLFTIHDSNLL